MLKDFPSVEKVFYRISKLMLLKFSFLFGQMWFLTSTHWKYLFFLFLFLPLSLFSQQRKELLEQQKRLRNDIRLTSNLLKETQKNREATLERFLDLQRQIKARKQLINSIQREIQI